MFRQIWSIYSCLLVLIIIINNNNKVGIVAGIFLALIIDLYMYLEALFCWNNTNVTLLFYQIEP